MAKKVVLGSFLKSKDDTKPPYIKLKTAVNMPEGGIIRVESKKFQLASLEAAVSAGKLTGEVAESARARIERMPDWVLGDLVIYQD